MEITELAPTPFVLPTAGDLVHIRTQRWALERWEGEDPPALATPWARKPKFSVNGSRSCAELAIVDHLRGDGWRGRLGECLPRRAAVRVVPRPGDTDTGRGGRAVVGRGDLRPSQAANGGTLSGFFDVFAWWEPGQVGLLRGEGRARPGQADSAQVRGGSVAPPPRGGVHDRRGGWAIAAGARQPVSPGRLYSGTHGSRWRPSPPLVARICCGGPGETCCRRSATSPGKMSRKRARCSATWPQHPSSR